MRQANVAWQTKLPAIAILACALIVTSLGGCGSRRSKGSDFEQLVLTRYRYVIDEKHGIGRVFAEVRNDGKTSVRQVEARAYLRSRGGETRGENATVLRNLGPGETQAFSIAITTHGRAQDVAIEFHAVGEPPVEEETSAGSTKTRR